MKNILRINVLIIVFWAGSGICLAAEDKELKKLIDEAKTFYKKATAIEGGWTSTNKLIKSAELSASKGKKQQAIEMAKKAKAEAELSFTQALNQRKSWTEPPYLLK